MATREQVEIYLRANEDDTMRGDWEDILAACEKPVAEAFIAVDLWKDDYTWEESPPMDLRPPTLQFVLDNALCTEFLVFADDKQKQDILNWMIENNKFDA